LVAPALPNHRLPQLPRLTHSRSWADPSRLWRPIRITTTLTYCSGPPFATHGKQVVLAPGMIQHLRHLPAAKPQFVASSAAAGETAFERRPLFLHHLPAATSI